MKSLVLSAMLFVFVSACGSQNDSQLNNVFGSDDRVELTTNQYPWRSIGKMSNGCTGTLVGKNLVLTAAHCVYKDGELKTNVEWFYPNFRNGSYSHKSWINHVWAGTKTPNKSNHRQYDWAVLRLDDNMGDTYGWLGVNSTTVASFPSQLTVAGYSNNFASGQTAGVHHNCSTKKRDTSRGFILHDCDTSRGSSGGPALRMENDKLTIFGINVAEYRNGGDQSLYRTSYENAYGNIAIPTQAAVRKIIELSKK